MSSPMDHVDPAVNDHFIVNNLFEKNAIVVTGIKN